MVSILSDILTSFVLGLLTPTTAVCVLPLYPGFIAYIANKFSGQESNKKLLILFSLVITFGVIAFMFLLGLIFTTFLEISLTRIIGVVSPIAFGLMGLISILLILDIDIGKYLPKAKTPMGNNPLKSAFSFGFFFGAIVIPCNPLFIAALFTKALATNGFAANMASFISFGIGIGFPLIALTLISSTKSTQVINFLVNHKKTINRLSGMIMLGISLYYLLFVFRILG